MSAGHKPPLVASSGAWHPGNSHHPFRRKLASAKWRSLVPSWHKTLFIVWLCLQSQHASGVGEQALASADTPAFVVLHRSTCLHPWLRLSHSPAACGIRVAAAVKKRGLQLPVMITRKGRKQSVTTASEPKNQMARNFKAKATAEQKRVHRLLNKSIMEAAEVSTLGKLIVEQHHEFNIVNAFTAYRQLLRRGGAAVGSRAYTLVEGRVVLSPRDTEHINFEATLALAEQGVMKHVEAAGARECSNVMHAISTSRCNPREDILRALEEQMLLVSQTFNPQDIANTLWAYATMGRQPSELMLAGLLARTQDIADEFQAQNLANTLWSVAKLHGRSCESHTFAPEEKLISALTHRIVAVGDSLNNQELTNVLWAHATLGFEPNDTVLAAISEKAARGAPSFNPQNIANTLWAFAKLRRTPDPCLLSALTERGTAVAHEFKPQEIANTLWALAALALQPGEDLLSALSSRATATARQFNPQDCANILWSFATLSRAPDDVLLHMLTQQAARVAHKFEAQHIGNILWALATVAHEPEYSLVRALTERAAVVAPHFNTQNIANALWGTCMLAQTYPGTTGELIDVLVPRAIVLFDASSCALALSGAGTELERVRCEKLVQELCALHQCLLTYQFEPALQESMPSQLSIMQEVLAPWCKEAFLRQQHTAFSSRCHLEVSHTLRSMGLSVQDEVICDKSGYTLDMLCATSRTNAHSRTPHMNKSRTNAHSRTNASHLSPSSILTHVNESQTPHMNESQTNAHSRTNAHHPSPSSPTHVNESHTPHMYEPRTRESPSSTTVHSSSIHNSHQIESEYESEYESKCESKCDDKSEREEKKSAPALSPPPLLPTRLHSAEAAPPSTPEYQWVVEFDGPSHFLTNGSPSGSTLMKRHHLALLGYTLVSLPFHEWTQVRTLELTARQLYLRQRLPLSQDATR